jgi:WD40 repeat protein
MRKLRLLAFSLLFVNIISAQDMLNERLLEAVKHNRLDSLKILVDQGADVNYTDSNKAPVLMWAAYKADLKMVKYLVGKGADYTKKGIISFEDGSYYGNLTGLAAGERKLDMLKYFVEECKIDANDKEINRDGIIKENAPAAIEYSLSYYYYEISKYLIQKGAVYNLHNYMENDEEIDLLLYFLSIHPEGINQQNSNGQSILSRLIREFDIKASPNLITGSTELNQQDIYGDTPLHYAVIRHKKEWVSILVDKGADLNIRNNAGKTPIFYALDYENAENLQYLLDSQSNVDIADKEGKHLLFYAIDKNNLKLIDYCLNYGISIELRGPEGRTPLLYSLFLLNPQLGSYFIDKGADLNASDDKGETAFQIAYRRNYYSILKKMQLSDVDTQLPKQFPVQLKIPLGNSDFITSIDITSDGKYLLASSESSLLLYDLKVKKEIKTLIKQNLSNQSASFSPNDSLICSFSSDQISIWETNTGEFIKKIQPNQLLARQQGIKEDPISNRYLSSVLFLPDNISLLFGYGFTYYSKMGTDKEVKISQGSIYLLNIGNEKIIEKLDSPVQQVKELEMSSDFKYILASFDNSYVVYDGINHKIVMQVSFDNLLLDRAHFSYDNRSVISCTSDSLMNYYDISSHELVKTFKLHDIIYEFAQSPEGKYFALASGRNFQFTDKDLKNIELPGIPREDNWGNKFNFTTDGKYLVFCDGLTIKLVAINNDFSSKDLTFENIQLSSFCKTNDDKSIAIGSRKYRPVIWNLGSGHLTKVSAYDDFPTQDLSFYNDNTQIITAGFGDYDTNTCRSSLFLRWDSETGNLLDTIFHPSDVLYEQYAGLGIHDSAFFLTHTIGTSNKYKVRTGRLAILDAGNSNIILEDTGFEYNVYSVCVSNNGKYILTGGGESRSIWAKPDGTLAGPNELLLFDRYSGEILKKFIGHRMPIFSIDFSPDDRTFISASLDNSLILWDIQSGDILKTFSDPAQFGMNSVSFSPDGKYILTGSSNAYVSLWDVQSGKLIRSFSGHQGPVKKVLFSKDGKLAFSASEDNTIKIWNLEEGSNLATLIPLPDAEWVVTTPAGLFDASPGAMKMIYYVAGMETIDLDQLKLRYYQPGLLQILLGYRDEPLRDVQGLNSIELYPSSKLEIIDNKLNIALENRGGGIGQVSLYIDDIEIIPDLRPEPFNPDTSNATLTVDLDEYARYFNYDTTNVIGIITWNEEAYLRSRKDTIHFRPQVAGKRGGGEAGKHGGMEAWGHGGMKNSRSNPRLYAVVVGIADYLGTKIDLRYAGKDAAEFAYALDLGAENYFGPGNVFINLFTTDSTKSNNQPTKTNIINAFARCADSAGPGDYLLVYLAGHGITYGGPDGDFYYLTQEAFDTDSKIFMDPAICKSVTISAEELTATIDSITARKKVLILDVCAAGNAAEQIFAGVRDVPGNVTRVLDNMQDRTGIYILAGCEANASSYETTVYGQGLLAYSLLSAMKGNALKMYNGEEYVDVNTLLQYARDQVPMLTGGAMQRQAPFIKVPDNDMGYFIGMMTPEDKKKIELSQPKPVFMSSLFLNEKGYEEVDLINVTNKKLNEITSRGKDAELVYTDALSYPGSYKLSGNYKITGEDIRLNLNIMYNNKLSCDPIIVSGKVSELDQFAQKIIFRAYQEIEKK